MCVNIIRFPPIHEAWNRISSKTCRAHFVSYYPTNFLSSRLITPYVGQCTLCFFICNNNDYVIPISPGDFWCIFSCQTANVYGLCNHGPEHQGILINQTLVIYEFKKEPYSAGNIWVIPDRPTCWAWDYGVVLFKAPILAGPTSRWITAAMLYQLGWDGHLKLCGCWPRKRVLRWCCAIWRL